MNKHATDAVSLGFGSVFLAAVAGWLVTSWFAVDPPSVGWLVAGGLVLLGVFGLVATILQRRGDDPGAST